MFSLSGHTQSFSGGDGSASSPYLIKSTNDLRELSSVVIGGNTLSGSYVSLEADIDFSGQQAFVPVGYTGTTTPKRFAGTFLGNGHVISGISMEGTYYVGLFSYLETTASVKDLTLKGTVIEASNNYTGAIAAYNAGSVVNCTVDSLSFKSTGGTYKGGVVGYMPKNTFVIGCSVSGNIASGTSVGGVVGYSCGNVENCNCSANIISTSTASANVYLGGVVSQAITVSPANGDPYTVMKNCYFTGTISGATNNVVGGVAASFNVGNMTECWNSGSLSGTGYMGGLVGILYAATVKDCYNAGTITAPISAGYPVGGIFGFVSTTSAYTQDFKNCLNYGSMTMGINCQNETCGLIGSPNEKSKVKNLIYDWQATGYFTDSCGRSTAQLTSGALEDFDPEVWKFSAGMYPRLAFADTVNAAVVAAVPVLFPSGEAHYRVESSFAVGTAAQVTWSLEGGDGLSTLSDNKVSVIRGDKVQRLKLIASANGFDNVRYATVYPNIFKGTGTEDNPYIIENKEDLLKLSDATNAQQLSFTGEFFKMTADIDMNDDTLFVPMSSVESGLAFNGTFDGCGHSIKNLAIHTVETKKDGIGLFYKLAALGSLKNLTIDASCDFVVNARFAPFVYYNLGVVENCANYADICTALGYASGIVLYNQSGSIVRNCYNQGNIYATTSGGNIAGITYNNNSGSIENCQNAGNLTGQYELASSIAGITVSNTGSIINVLNTGTLQGSTRGTSVAGIANTNSAAGKMTNVLSVGPVNVNSLTNAASVTASSTGTFTNVFCDIQMTLYSNGQPGVTEATTSKLISGDPIFGEDAAWVYTAGRYPMLKSFAHNAKAQLGAMPVDFTNGSLRNNITGNATLCSDADLSWTITSGKALKISGSQLIFIPQDVACLDTLVASYKGYSRTIALRTYAPIFTGAGTKDSPYLINSCADIEALVSDMQNFAHSYEGCYFTMTQDIDMATATDYYPIGASGGPSFNGVFDGCNHTVKNLVINRAGTTLGLFGAVGATGVVKNITIDSTCSITARTLVGGVVGELAGTIDNCVNKAKIEGSGSAVGGVVGKALKGAVINNLINEGTISSKSTDTGGVIGMIYSTDSLIYASNLVNRGTVTVTGNKAGGIVGTTYYTILSDCVNYADIDGASKTNIAGIAGYSNNTTVFTNCINYGNVSGGTEVAGVAGYLYAISSGKYDVRITRCANYGDVIANTSTAAGLVARGYIPIISQCANFGNVANTKTSLSTSTPGAAGLTGRCNPTIINCLNAGNVTAGDNVSAMNCYYNSTSDSIRISNVYNIGAIKAENATVKYCNQFYNKQSTSLKIKAQNCYYDRQVACEQTSDSIALNTAALVALDLGDDWSNTTGGYPILKWLENDTTARVATAAVVLSEKDTYAQVTAPFALSAAPFVQWSGDNVFVIEGNSVNPVANTVGVYSLKAAAADVERKFTLTLDIPSGVESVVDVADDYSIQGSVITFNIATPYTVVAVDGRVVARGTASQCSTLSLGRGVYIITTGSGSRKLRL